MKVSNVPAVVSTVSLEVTFIGIDDTPTKIISHGAPTAKYLGSLAISLIAKIDESMRSKYNLNFSLTGPDIKKPVASGHLF
jgi:hypothetical protein